MNFDAIIDKFINFDNIEVIKNVQYSPDTILTLLNFDNKKHVLVETDYFDKHYETMHIKETFGLEAKQWLKPKNYNPKEYDAPAYYNKKTKVAYGLAELNNYNNTYLEPFTVMLRTKYLIFVSQHHRQNSVTLTTERISPRF